MKTTTLTHLFIEATVDEIGIDPPGLSIIPAKYRILAMQGKCTATLAVDGDMYFGCWKDGEMRWTSGIPQKLASVFLLHDQQPTPAFVDLAEKYDPVSRLVRIGVSGK